MLPLASTRISLAWPPSPPHEETDTLVISGRTGFFLDLRVLVAGPKAGEIDWATAGLKQILSGSEEDGNLKASFAAFIDSRKGSSTLETVAVEDELEDEGSFRTLLNGDVLETGVMPNPVTGRVEPYEEVWRRIHNPKDEMRVVIIERGEDATKSFVGRVGRWEIGMRASSTEPFRAWRYDQDADGQWREIHCVGGDLARKCIPRIPDEGLSGVEGTQIVLLGEEWVIRENS